MNRAHPLVREALLSAGAAATLATLLAWLGPPGSDLAAHAYQRSLYVQEGFELWNNFWYAGRYSFVTYSVLYYPLAALLGIKLLAVATIATAALAFAVVLGREWGPTARWSSRTFAVVWAGVVLSAAFPVRARDGARSAGAVGAAGGRQDALRPARGSDARRKPALVPAAGARGRRRRHRAPHATSAVAWAPP